MCIKEPHTHSQNIHNLRQVFFCVQKKACVNDLQVQKKNAHEKSYANPDSKSEKHIKKKIKQRAKNAVLPPSDDWPEWLHLQHGFSYSGQPETDG